MRNPKLFAGERRVQHYHATKISIFTSNNINTREKRQDRRVLATETGDVGQLEAPGDQFSQACKVARQRPLSFFGGAIVGILALDISQDPLKSWIEERAAESGLAFRAARKKLEKAQNVSKS
eukprot:jgi/Picsp_1/3543/NSC_06381-R1_upf0426 protein chloroplastic-like